MRAPPFSVCNWRCSSATRSLSLRSRFQAVSDSLGRLDQLGRLLAVDIGDLVIELLRGGGALSAAAGVLAARAAGGAGRGAPAARAPRPACQLRHDRGSARLDDACASSTSSSASSSRRRSSSEGCSAKNAVDLVDVRDDVVDGAHRIREHRERRHRTGRGRCRTPCACSDSAAR